MSRNSTCLNNACKLFLSMKCGNRILKKVYLTEEENRLYTEKAKQFNGFSNYARIALLDHSDMERKNMLAVSLEVISLMKARERTLSGIGNNINQIAHRLNIFAIEGYLDEALLNNSIIPAIQNIHKMYGDILANQLMIVKKLFPRPNKN